MDKSERALNHCICGNCINNFDCGHCTQVNETGVCKCDCVDVTAEDADWYKKAIAYFKETGKRLSCPEMKIVFPGVL